MIIVHEPNFKNVILSSFQNSGKPPPMIVEFYKDNTFLYSTSSIKGFYNTDLNTIQLYAINPNPADDCTKVIWRSIDGRIIYEVRYSTFLTRYAMQVCHIVISYDPTDPPDMQYLEIPADILNALLEEEGPKIVNYYLSNTVAVPESRLYVNIEYDNSRNKLYGIVNVDIDGRTGKIKKVGDVYTIEFQE